MGYDDDNERLAVLDAGLTVRGTEFAIELCKLTGEALEDFRAMTSTSTSGEDGRVNVVVDPELVRRVESIDGRIRTFINRSDIGTDVDFQ